jgi:hypothetical protein
MRMSAKAMPERMSPKRMILTGMIVLGVVFLSPIAYLTGQRAGLWLTTPALESAGPWPSLDEGEMDPGGMGEKLKPATGGVVEI